MMRIRFTGDGDRDLAISSGCLRFPSGQWVDIEEAARAARIPVGHALIIAQDVLDQPEWELETIKTPAKPVKES